MPIDDDEMIVCLKFQGLSEGLHTLQAKCPEEKLLDLLNKSDSTMVLTSARVGTRESGGDGRLVLIAAEGEAKDVQIDIQGASLAPPAIEEIVLLVNYGALLIDCGPNFSLTLPKKSALAFLNKIEANLEKLKKELQVS